MVLESKVSQRSVSMGKPGSILSNLVSNERELNDFLLDIQIVDYKTNMIIQICLLSYDIMHTPFVIEITGVASG